MVGGRIAPQRWSWPFLVYEELVIIRRGFRTSTANGESVVAQFPSGLLGEMTLALDPANVKRAVREASRKFGDHCGDAGPRFPRRQPQNAVPVNQLVSNIPVVGKSRHQETLSKEHLPLFFGQGLEAVVVI